MSTLKTRVLTNGKSTWRFTRVSDYCLTAKNGFGKEHKWTGKNAMTEATIFENFLASKGFTPLVSGRSLNTLVRKTA